MGPMTASYRMRSASPAAFLGGKVNESHDGGSELYVFSKPLPDDLTLARELKAEGVKFVVDIIDDHFRNVMVGNIYAEMIRMADLVVCPTENMSDRLVKYGLKPADIIIPEAYEEPHGDPHANGAEKFLWFGSQGNLKEIRPWIKNGTLAGHSLAIVTGPNENLGHDWTQWTPETQTTALQASQVVLIPTRKGVEYKSANRLVNALRAGCFPVCGGGIPSFKEFRQFAWVGQFETGLQFVKAVTDELNDRVAAGQQYIQKFSPQTIGKLWEDALTRVGDTYQ